MSHLKEAITLGRRFLPYLDGVWACWFQICILMALSPALSAALLWSGKLLIDDVFVNKAFDHLPILISIYFVISISKLIVGYFSTRLDAALTTTVAQAIRVDLYRHLITLAPGSLKRSNTGDLLSRLSSDVESVEYFIYSGPMGCCANIVRSLIFFLVLLSLSWKLTVCAITIAPLLAAAGLLTAPRIRRAARVARRQAAACTSLAEERLNATTTIQANTAEEFESRVYRRQCGSSRTAELKVVAVQAWSAAQIEVVAILGGLAVILVGAMNIQSGALTIGTLIAFIGSIGSLYGPITSLAKTPGRFHRAAVRAQRVRELLDARNAVVERPGAPPLLKPRGRLEFNDVVFGYNKSQRVLDGITFKAEPGETVAIVGPSGSGKSSLANLAVRLYDPWEGSVKIDGHDLRDVTIQSVRQAVSIVLQEPYLFSGSIADNIKYSQVDICSEGVQVAGSLAQVSSFAGTMRGGYDSPVGARGAWLSGGQRQRISIARAVLRDSPILIFDEATGAIDSEAEEKVQDEIERHLGHKTIILIGHRLSSIRRADRVILIENGRIAEVGSPSTLLRADSRCRALFSAQLVSEECAA
jgi:ABC-type multidrug transport system fused ATPase/permease subunit